MPWASGDSITSDKLNYRSGLVVSVLDPVYSCDSSGAADSTVSLRAAVSDLTAAGGGTLLVSRGTFSLSSRVLLGDNISIEGAGYGSILSNTTAGFLGGQVGLLHASETSGNRITNIRLLGTGDDGLVSFHGCNNASVDHCWLEQASSTTQNTAAVGIYDDDVGGSERTSLNFSVTNNFIKPSGNAVLVQGRASGPYNIRNVVISGNHIDCSNTTAFGIIKPDLFTRDIVVTNNIIEGKGAAQDGIHFEEASGFAVISGNIISDCSRTGIMLDDGQTNRGIENVVVRGNTIRNITSSVGDGIRLVGGGSQHTNIMIANNSIDSCGRNAVREHSSSSVNGLLITGNICSNTTGIIVRSHYAVVSHNIISSSRVSYPGLEVTSNGSGVFLHGNYLRQLGGAGAYITDNGDSTLSVGNQGTNVA